VPGHQAAIEIQILRHTNVTPRDPNDKIRKIDRVLEFFSIRFLMLIGPAVLLTRVAKKGARQCLTIREPLKGPGTRGHLSLGQEALTGSSVLLQEWASELMAINKRRHARDVERIPSNGYSQRFKVFLRVAVFAALTLSVCLARSQPPRTSSASRIAAPTTDPKIILNQARDAVGGKVWEKVRALHIRSVLAIGGRAGNVDTFQDATTGRFLREIHIPSGEKAEGFDGLQCGLSRPGSMRMCTAMRTQH
jgi:hypothetical protein